MKLTGRLLSFLNRVFGKDPEPFLALRLSYAGGAMTWRVQDAVLTTVVNGGPGANLSVDLRNFTVTQLAQHLAAQPGYSVLYLDGTENAGLGARVLIDGAGDINASNGDHLYGYTSVLWSYLEAMADALQQAEVQIREMLRQMSTTTAEGEWLDELGGYYGIPRLQGESDAAYGPRIIAEVLRPRTNNVAIELAIQAYTGQATKVTDAVDYIAAFPTHDGAITHNGAQTYNSGAKPIYGRFDVQYGYDLENGGSFSEFQAVIRALIERLRAGGTQLRALSLTSGALADTAGTPTDLSAMPLVVSPALDDSASAPADTSIAMDGGFTGLDDDLTAPPTDSGSLTFTPSFTHSGLRFYDGSIEHRGSDAYSEGL